MGDFYPYKDFSEARDYLCRYADEVASPSCGITFGDGRNICVIRKPSRRAQLSIWMNVLKHDIPPPPPIAPTSVMADSTKSWFERTGETYNYLAQTEAGIPPDGQYPDSPNLARMAIDKYNQLTADHPLIAGGLLVAGDVLGIVLAGVAIFSGVGLVAGATALIAGAASGVLLSYDGAIFYADYSGDSVRARKIEKDSVTIRTWATVALLIDLPVSGWRALTDLRELKAAGAIEKTYNADMLRRAAQKFGRAAKYDPESGSFRAVTRDANSYLAQAKKAHEEVMRIYGRIAAVTGRDMIAAPTLTLNTEVSMFAPMVPTSNTEASMPAPMLSPQSAAGDNDCRRPGANLEIILTTDENM